MAGIDASTKLMLHCNGTNGSTTVTDSSGTGKTVTCHGAAVISNANVLLDAEALYLPGASGDYADVASHADFNFGSHDFTIDFWVREESNGGVFPAYIARDRASTWAPFLIGYGGTDIYMSSNGTAWDIASGQSLGTPVLNAKSHIEIGRMGSTFFAFRDGVLTSTWTSSLAFPTNSNPLSIGSAQGGSARLKGRVDELRISNKCQHTSNFTPPTIPYFADPVPLPTASYGQVVASATASGNAFIDLVDATGVPCDHYQIEFIHAVSDLEITPSAGALLTAYVSTDGGASFDTGPYYNSTGINNYPEELNRYFLPPFPFGLPQTLNMGLRLSIDTGDMVEYGATGVANIYNNGAGFTQYTSKSIKGALTGTANASMPAIMRPAQAAFSGLISGNTLTVKEVYFGTISTGQLLDGAGITAGTTITGGSGTSWTISTSQTVGQTMIKAVASSLAFFPSNGSTTFGWDVQVDYAGHYSGSTSRPNAFRLKMDGGGTTGLLIASGTFKLRRLD